MKTLAFFVAITLASVPGKTAEAPASSRLQLPAQRELFFVENDLVYSRYLLLSRDGTYRQFHQVSNQSRETDQGEWRQDLRGSLQLHSTRDALRYRALLSGPLSLVPNRAAFDALPSTSTRIRRFLDRTTDSVFARAAANDLQVLPAGIIVAHDADTFSRDDLAALANQIDHFIESTRTHVYTLDLLKPKNVPLLLVQTDAVFQSRDVTRIVAACLPTPGEPLPFYFTQADAGTFARRVGSWQELPLLGDSE